jgi:hypothetical protein
VTTSVTGMLKVGEASATMQDVGTRQRGPRYTYYLLMFGLMLGGAVIGGVIYQPNAGAGSMIGMGVGLFVYAAFARRWTVARFRKRMIEKGFAVELPLSLKIAPDTLEYQVGEVRHIAPWDAVSELFSSRGYSIFLVQSSPFFAPKRFFVDQNAEREFIATALAHMSVAARGRSPRAVEFAKV